MLKLKSPLNSMLKLAQTLVIALVVALECWSEPSVSRHPLLEVETLARLREAVLPGTVVY